MASILDRYGIKEVCDVTFYELDANGAPTNPVLYLDTLKVSTIEQTAEEATATGGKGNAPLIVWDYGREITITLEDALFSAKSLAMMFGSGVQSYTGCLMRTETFVATANSAPSAAGWNPNVVLPNGSVYSKINPKFYNEKGETIGSNNVVTGSTYFCTYDVKEDAPGASVITISAQSFPGTYYVTGDTYARSEASGKDEFLQFIIPKAKIQSEQTITMEADGDPSVFNMNLRVLRAKDGSMMKLVKYDLAGSAASTSTPVIPHNHNINGDNAT